MDIMKDVDKIYGSWMFLKTIDEDIAKVLAAISGVRRKDKPVNVVDDLEDSDSVAKNHAED